MCVRACVFFVIIIIVITQPIIKEEPGNNLLSTKSIRIKIAASCSCYAPQVFSYWNLQHITRYYNCTAFDVGMVTTSISTINGVS